MTTAQKLLIWTLPPLIPLRVERVRCTITIYYQASWNPVTESKQALENHRSIYLSVYDGRAQSVQPKNLAQNLLPIQLTTCTRTYTFVGTPCCSYKDTKEIDRGVTRIFLIFIFFLKIRFKEHLPKAAHWAYFSCSKHSDSSKLAKEKPQRSLSRSLRCNELGSPTFEQ